MGDTVGEQLDRPTALRVLGELDEHRVPFRTREPAPALLWRADLRVVIHNSLLTDSNDHCPRWVTPSRATMSSGLVVAALV